MRRTASSALLARRHSCPSKRRKCSNAVAIDWSSSTTRMSAMTLIHGDRHPGARPFRFGSEQLDGTAMALDHGLGIHEAEADAVPLGGDERVEYAVADSRVDADA